MYALKKYCFVIEKNEFVHMVAKYHRYGFVSRGFDY